MLTWDTLYVTLQPERSNTFDNYLCQGAAQAMQANQWPTDANQPSKCSKLSQYSSTSADIDTYIVRGQLISSMIPPCSPQHHRWLHILPTFGKTANKMGFKADVHKFVLTLILQCKKPQVHLHVCWCIVQPILTTDLPREQELDPKIKALSIWRAECSTQKQVTNQGAKCLTQKQATIQPGSRMLAQPKSKPPSNQGAECSTQKHATVHQGSIILNPEACHHTNKKQSAQSWSWPANDSIIILKSKHELTACSS